MDAVKFIEEFINKATWLAKENANMPFSFGALFFRTAGKAIEEYVLTKVYSPEISKAHLDGDFHIHNLYMGICGYCAGWDAQDLLLRGFRDGPGYIASNPPKHLSTALLQIANFIGSVQNEWAGAQAFNSLDTFLAPYIAYEKLSYKQVKQALQEFIYNLNISSRWGGQTPFTNITFDIKPPEDLASKHVIYAGKLMPETYSDFEEEILIFNKAFLEVMLEGDASKRPFTFPIPTYNITKDFPWKSEVAELIFELSAKYGSPYFSNFINSDLKPSDVRSMCCRLRLDLRELKRNVTSGLFGSGVKTGSVGVVTINMPRIAYLSKDEDEFFERLSRLMELAKQSLEIKRKFVQRLMDLGLFPYSKHYLGTLQNHFSTIGLVGMNEACLNFLGTSIASKEGKNFAIKVLKFMLSLLKEFQQETGHLFNLEATPAEGASYRLAKLDKQKFPDIITAGKEEPYYTNSTWLPVSYSDDPFFVLEHQEELQCLYTGGTVIHFWLGERISSEEAKLFVKKVFSHYRVPYITLTPTYSICPKHGYFAGKHEVCPICGAKTEVYSRVVGYLRPVQRWNPGKQEEFKERKTYRLRPSGGHHSSERRELIT